MHLLFGGPLRKITMSESVRKILQIEDNLSDAGLIREMLDETGNNYALTTADRLSSGLKLLEDEVFDVVLVDLGLPDSDGIDTLRRLQDKNSALPVIVLTGFVDEGLAVKAIGLGAQDYLVKGRINGALLIRSIRYAIERKRAGETLERESKKLAILYEVALTIGKFTDLKTILNDALDRIISFMGVDAGVIYVINEDTMEMLPVAFRNLSAPVVKDLCENKVKVGECVCGSIAQCDKEVIILEKASLDPRFTRGVVKQENMEFYAGLPIKARNKVVGVLCVITHIPYTPDGELLDILRAVTQPIGLAIEHKRSEEDLQYSESRFRGIASAALDALILIDNDGMISFWNDAATKIFGYTTGEMAGKYLHSFIMPDRYKADFEKGFEKFRTTGKGPFIGKTYEVEGIRKGGAEFPMELSLAALKLKDKWNAIGIARDITERKRLEEEIRHMAHHDPLTDLPNRRLFREIVAVELAQAVRNGKKLAILFLDLDRFKEINDTLGHEVGDELLKQVAVRLRSNVRRSDTLARIGGDEFNMILADVARAEDVAEIAAKIVQSFRRPFIMGPHEFLITTSIGISIYPDDGDDIDTLLRYADIAMYYAKEYGRNNYQFYNPTINIRSLERIRLESSLRRTVERSELIMHYQPLIDINSRRIVCAEALARWQHPEMGLLEPERFIPLAEETGFISAIDEWALRSVCGQIKEWTDSGFHPPCITVNLSGRQFQNPELVDKVAQILQETGISPDLLEIEITESTAMKNLERTVLRLQQLTKMGVSISIDDFGTGYSSLSYLKRLPIQKLKIDQSFIRDIATDPDDRAIISAVTSMARKMSIRTVAEGVETEEQFSFLRASDCDEAQGFLFSRPLPAQKFRELIVTGK